MNTGQISSSSNTHSSRFSQFTQQLLFITYITYCSLLHTALSVFVMIHVDEDAQSELFQCFYPPI